MPNIVTYCRVSSEEQAEKDNSIPAQRKALRSWAAQNPGTTIVREFVDEGISAYAPADRRPGFCEMISFCRKNDVDLIVVHKLDRFSRNREESILFKGLLRKHNVQVRSVSETYDPESPQGFLYEGMIEVINQFYSMNLATEVLKGCRENASRGWVNGGVAPYGYRVKKVTDEGGRVHNTYEPGDEAEVAIIREIFAMADAGQGAKVIAAALNARGVRGPASKHWNQSAIGNILTNPVYVGDLVWMKTKKKGRTGRVVTKPEERVVTKNAHPALIERELFDRLRQRAPDRQFRVHSSPHKHVNYLLGRLITCDCCGNAFVGRRREYVNHKGEKQVNLSYFCSGYLFKGRDVCESLPLDMAWIEGIVIDALKARFCDPAGWDELERKLRSRIEARRRKYGVDPRAAQAKLSEIDRRIDNYYRALGEGMDVATCKRLIAELTEKKAAMEQEIETLQTEDYYVVALEKNLKLLAAFRSRLRDGFERLPFAAQRQVVVAFVEGIHVRERREVVVKLKVALDNDGIKHLTDELDRAEDAGRKPETTKGPSGLEEPFEGEGPFCQSGPRWCPLVDEARTRLELNRYEVLASVARLRQMMWTPEAEAEAG